MVDVENLIEEVRKYPVLYDQTSDKYRNSEYKERIWKNISTTLEAIGGIEECKKKWASVRDQLRRTIQKRKSSSAQSAARNRKYKYEDILDFLVPHIEERDTLSYVPVSEETEDEMESLINVRQEEFTQQTNQLENTNNIWEPETEIQTHLIGTMDNTFRSSASIPNFSEKNTKFTRPAVSLKRKSPQCEGYQFDSPANQLMAYILTEKETQNKMMTLRGQDYEMHPVDAFLRGIAPTLKSFNPLLLNQAKSKIFSIVQEFEIKQLTNSHKLEECD